MPRLKRAPPYDDDPGCKYIVIGDPWPGDKIGKARDEAYWNRLCAWVRFMFNKEHDPICVYSVNTRNEVIVQLPQDADIVPVLGAHPWIKMLSAGNPRDRERVSYVFAYDYRMKGEPDNHNWLAHYPTESGDPPEWIRFPVRFPYPHASWASPQNKSYADISLPLPPVRQPTPIPDTSGFAPYQHPAQLTANTVDNAGARNGGDTQPEVKPTNPNQLDKMDQYEEGNALRILERESADVKPRIKREDGILVKTEAIKPDPELYAPSKAFRAAIEQVQQARACTYSSAISSSEPAGPGRVKPEEEPPRDPSEAFVAAFNSVRGAQPHEQTVPASQPKVKGEEIPYQPSNAFVAAIAGLRGPPSTTNDHSQRTPSADIPVKSEPDSRRSSTSKHAGLKLEDEDRRRAGEGRTMSAGSAHQGTTSLKRVKEEPHDGRHGKRFRQ